MNVFAEVSKRYDIQQEAKQIGEVVQDVVPKIGGRAPSLPPISPGQGRGEMGK